MTFGSTQGVLSFKREDCEFKCFIFVEVDTMNDTWKFCEISLVMFKELRWRLNPVPRVYKYSPENEQKCDIKFLSVNAIQ